MCENKCVIVGAGDFTESELNINVGDFVIAADGGYNHLLKIGVKPDLLMGDFDSLGDLPENIDIKRFKAEKDDTDTALAIEHGIELGYKLFHLYGCTGGRLEHTVANIQCLVRLSRSRMRGYIFSKEQIITSITNDVLSFDSGCKGYISAFAYGGDAKGVYERGLKYPLTDATIRDDVPLGVSNRFTGEDSSVSVGNGTLIVMWERN